MTKAATASKYTIPSLLTKAAKRKNKPATFHMENLQPSKSSCERQTVLYLKSGVDYGLVGEPNPALDTYAKLGYAIEDIVLDNWRNVEYGKLHANAVKFNLTESKLPLFGKLDGLVTTVNENGKLELFGLEIKSCTEFPNEIEEHHLTQVSLYSAIFGLPFVVLYVKRNPALFSYEKSMKEFYYRPTDSMSQERMTRLYYAWLCSLNDVLPDKPFADKNNKICSFCPFVELCWTDQLEQHFEPLTDAKHDELVEQATIWSTQFIKDTPGRRVKLLTKFNLDNYQQP